MGTRVLLIGACGAMGQRVINVAASQDVDIISVDRSCGSSCSCNGFKSLDEVNVDFDVILDFSVAHALPNILAFAKKKRRPLVIAATGHTKEQQKQIEDAACVIPILKSGNFSISVNRFIDTVAKFATTWDGDIEIIEVHHNKKADAPSGTAMMIAEAIKKARQEDAKFVLGRGPNSGKRQQGEIGISAIRGGVVVGEHEVRFYDDTSEVFFKERELSKDSFAKGALRATKFLLNKKANKLYNMKDLLG